MSAEFTVDDVRDVRADYIRQAVESDGPVTVNDRVLVAALTLLEENLLGAPWVRQSMDRMGVEMGGIRAVLAAEDYGRLESAWWYVQDAVGMTLGVADER